MTCDYCWRPPVVTVIPKRSLTLWRPSPRRVCRRHFVSREWRTGG